MIISLRGTHGSGKSTVVKSLLDRYPSVPIIGSGKKPDGYEVKISWLEKPLYIVGSYVTACGGCDGIQPYSLIWPWIDKYADKGHVIFEGALVSSSYGNIGRSSEKYGDSVVFAFMDTPLETCINWVVQRRLSRGVDKPFDPKNVTSKHKNVTRSIDVITKVGRRVVMINHKKAVPQILGLLRSSK